MREEIERHERRKTKLRDMKEERHRTREKLEN
jgi:hypothetical protein